MTTTPVTPSKAKTWTALVGAALSFVIPFVLEVSTALPAPWPALIGAVVAALTALGVYRAPYVPPTAVVVPAPDAPADPEQPRTRPAGKYPHPWR